MEGASWQLDDASRTRFLVFISASSKSLPSFPISSTNTLMKGPPSPAGPSSAVFPDVVENTMMEFSTSVTTPADGFWACGRDRVW